MLGVRRHRPLAIAAIRMAADNQAAIPLPADTVQLLPGRKGRECRLGSGRWSHHPCPQALAQGLYVIVESATIPGTTYLAAEEMAEHAAAPQVPDDNEAPAVANEDLVGVSRVFLQSLYHLKHPPLAGILWQPGQGEHREPTPMCTHGAWLRVRHSCTGTPRGGSGHCASTERLPERLTKARSNV